MEQLTWFSRHLHITLIFSRKRSENITALFNNISTGVFFSLFSVYTLIFPWITLSFCQSTLSVSNVCPEHSSQLCSARHLDYCFGHAFLKLKLFCFWSWPFLCVFKSSVRQILLSSSSWRWKAVAFVLPPQQNQWWKTPFSVFKYNTCTSQLTENTQ